MLSGDFSDSCIIIVLLIFPCILRCLTKHYDTNPSNVAPKVTCRPQTKP